MPTAVLDLNYLCLPESINGLEAYSEALVLMRIGVIPACQVHLPVHLGQLNRIDLLEAVSREAGRSFWDAWLLEMLDPGSSNNPVFLPRPASVAICTRDRPDDLKAALTSLQALPDDGQELLVIDSCSISEDTRRVVEQFPAVRYIREDFPGLNRARNRALRESAHDIVAFIDDDARADRFWLRGLTRNFASPQVLCVTGLTMPYELESQAQKWFERYSPFSRGFAHWEIDRWLLSPLAANKAGAGANMALRKNILQLLGPFDNALDAGTETQSGGDTEMFARILSRGYHIIYDPAALNWHRHRRTMEELRRVAYGYGVGTYAVLTRRWMVDRDPGVVFVALAWLLQTQLPGLARSLLRRPNSIPLDICLQELRGCLAGPGAYRSSRAKLDGAHA